MELRIGLALRRIQSLADSGAFQPHTLGRVRYAEGEYPLVALSCGEPTLPTLVLVAGTHGDEPEGVDALLDFLESPDSRALRHHRLLALPLLNPSGLAKGTRANAAGQDINRQFHRNATPETTAARAFLSWETVSAVVDLHTDARAQGFYLFELLQSGEASYAPRLGAAVAGGGFALETSPFFGGYVGSGGLIVPTVAALTEFVRFAPGAALTQWAWQSGVPRSYVFETPQGAGEDACRAMHRLALNALLSAVGERNSDNATAE